MTTSTAAPKCPRCGAKEVGQLYRDNFGCDECDHVGKSETFGSTPAPTAAGALADIFDQAARRYRPEMFGEDDKVAGPAITRCDCILIATLLRNSAPQETRGDEPVAWARDPLSNLVERFSRRLLAKLRLAQANGRSGWERDDWEKECQQGLLRHVAKGDPRDVAAYCAFMDHHGWITVPAAPQQSPRLERNAVMEECAKIADAVEEDAERQVAALSYSERYGMEMRSDAATEIAAGIRDLLSPDTAVASSTNRGGK